MNAKRYAASPSAELSAAELLDELDEQQREVAQHQHGALCVLAGAGTGKTRAITYRIAYGVRSGQVDPENVLALTFTQKAAAEMKTRLEGLGVGQVWARTFHSAALAQVKHFWPQVMGGTMPTLTGLKATLVTAAGMRLGLNLGKAQLAGEIEWAKVSLVDPPHYAAAARAAGREAVADLSTERVAELLDAYEDAKIAAEQLDFEDILLLCAGMMDEREDVARTIRNQYRYFVVDEYQDVSPLQNYLLMSWLGRRRDLAVVGDAAQTIYSFAGATPEYLTEFTQTYPEAKVVELIRDYRSTPQIVNLANQVLSQAKGADGKPLGGTVRLVSQRESGPAVSWFAVPDDETEAKEIARRIQDLLTEGLKPSQIAVLFRTNAQAALFGVALGAKRIPFVIKDRVTNLAGGTADSGTDTGDDEPGGVTLASLHSAKGLEWEAVFLAGASEGLLPISLAKTAAAIEEERRLCYVGVTRARSRLIVSFAKARRDGAAQEREACRFLAPFWPRRSEMLRRSGRH
ncbi:ATP-dependent helicase [uncultured Mobiluncus sp.]|mgnify:FL=1|uniref:ATP-dependent helicase n=1 Tax=uncultured Mobiluncus sp. TaxID=293425 RepID=UPI00262A1107|nr:ATP-dependent helicase [uncultured Mobiluncus sp.]